MLPPSKKTKSSKTCPPILSLTSFWRFRQRITPRRRPAQRWASLGAIRLRNTAFRPHCYASTKSHWQQLDDLLYYRMQLYVPAAKGARKEVLRHHHDYIITGHFGVKRTLDFVARRYYWPGMVREVKAYTQACSTCQWVRPVRHRPHGNMEPLPQQRGLWTDISADFSVGLPVSRRKLHAKPHNTILVVVNRYTKQMSYFPCHDTLDAVKLAEILTKKLVLRGAGVPQRVVSDHMPQFTSKFWAAFCHHLHLNQCPSTVYYLLTDRQTERQNQTL